MCILNVCSTQYTHSAYTGLLKYNQLIDTMLFIQWLWLYAMQIMWLLKMTDLSVHSIWNDFLLLEWQANECIKNVYWLVYMGKR